MKDDFSLYRSQAAHWWDGSHQCLRLLHNLAAPRLLYFDRIVGDWHDLAVLDVGCGGGFMAEPLARRGAKIIGIDPVKEVITAASRHASREGLEIDYRMAFGEAIPLADVSVDCVVCVDVLEHVADLDRVLDEVARVLKPNGLFLFDTINRSILATLVIVYLGEVVLSLLPRGTHDPARFIRPTELRDKLAIRNLHVGSLIGFGPCGFNRRFDLTFGRLPTTEIMYMGHAKLLG
jgi:2-polyprenyl-6-hydroxyphenyl methylase/3-demethylubiquinone-9 3-methyltransferase